MARVLGKPGLLGTFGVVTAFGAIGALLGSLTVVEANPFGPAEGCCRYADGLYHTIYNSSLQSKQASAVTSARADVDATDAGPTQMHSSPASYTDVLAYDGNYGGSWATKAGVWRCIDALDATTCGQGELFFNLGVLDNLNGSAGSPYTQSERNAVACHEFGHSLGMDHGTNLDTCMHDPARDATPDYNSHNVSHLNAGY